MVCVHQLAENNVADERHEQTKQKEIKYFLKRQTTHTLTQLARHTKHESKAVA